MQCNCAEGLHFSAFQTAEVCSLMFSNILTPTLSCGAQFLSRAKPIDTRSFGMPQSRPHLLPDLLRKRMRDRAARIRLYVEGSLRMPNIVSLDNGGI